MYRNISIFFLLQFFLVACGERNLTKEATKVNNPNSSMDSVQTDSPQKLSFADTENCGLWDNTWLNDKTQYMLNNTYSNLQGATLCHSIKNKHTWGSKWNHNGKKGGLAGQIAIGQWPWSKDNTSKSNLPTPITSGTFYSNWEFTKSIQAGNEWNMFWEIWLHKSNKISSDTITLDLMIHPSYGQKGGTFVGIYTIDGVKWELRQHQHPGGFPLVHFYRQEQTDSPGQININKFWDISIQNGWGRTSDWVGSITAGQESYSGAGWFQTEAWDLRFVSNEK